MFTTMSSLLWTTAVASSVVSSLPPISSFNPTLLSQGDLSRAPAGTLLVSHHWGLGTHLLRWSPKTLLHRGPPALSGSTLKWFFEGTEDNPGPRRGPVMNIWPSWEQSLQNPTHWFRGETAEAVSDLEWYGKKWSMFALQNQFSSANYY